MYNQQRAFLAAVITPAIKYILQNLTHRNKGIGWRNGIQSLCFYIFNMSPSPETVLLLKCSLISLFDHLLACGDVDLHTAVLCASLSSSI